MASACDRRPDDVAVEVSVITERGANADPARVARGPLARTLRSATAQGLVRFDAVGGIEPGVAERWIVIDDGRSYIFRLGDAQWPDGSAVTADEVVSQLRRAIARQSRNPLSPFLTAIDEIVAMTPQVIEVRLSRPRPDLLKLFAQPQMTITAPSGRGGSGPFRIDSNDAGVFVLRPGYDPLRAADENAEDPRAEEYVRVRGERASAAVLRFAARRSDLVDGGTFNDWPLLAHVDIAPVNIRADAAEGLFGLAFVHRDGFLAEHRNRAAIAMAIDSAATLAAIRSDWAAVDTLLPARLDSAADPVPVAWSATLPADRITTAQAIAAEARAARQAPVPLRIALPATPGGSLLFAQLGAALRRAGFDPSRVQPGEAADLRLIDAVAPYDSARWYLQMACQPCAEPVAELIDEARTANTLAERARFLADADAALAADIAYIPLGKPLRWSLVAARLRAWTPNARAQHPLNHLRRDTN